LNEEPELADNFTDNPYAAPSTVTAAEPLDDQERMPEPKPVRVIIKWLVVCTVAAGPSFFFGGGLGNWRMPEVLGMITGILVFVAVYSSIEFLPQIRAAMAQRAKRKAARIAYLSRMGISILFPVGVFLDLYCGIASVGLAGVLMGQGANGFGTVDSGSGLPISRFLTFLFITIIQGTLLNILVFAFMAIVFGVLRAFGVKNSPL